MRVVISCIIIAVTMLHFSCSGPLYDDSDSSRTLRDRVIASIQHDLEQSKGGLHDRPHFDLDFYLNDDPERIREIDETTGPEAMRHGRLQADQILGVEASRTVRISLHQVMTTVLKNNLDVKIARLNPAISEADLASAEAAFDAVWFSEGTYTKSDRPQPVRVITSDPDGAGPLPPTRTPIGTAATVSDSMTLRTGIRRPMETGGLIEFSAGTQWTRNDTPGFNFQPDPSWTSDITLGIQQPLLRNFGTDVNRASIYISRNAHRSSVLRLHEVLNGNPGNVSYVVGGRFPTNTGIVAQAEVLYWTLVFLHRQQAIYWDDLKRAEGDREILKAREIIDARHIEVSQAESFVMGARENIINNTQQIYETSDQLKELMNDPNLPVTDDTVLVPIDEPITVPVQFELFSAIRTALNHRADALDALIDIDDASIRLKVARNLKLPQLDLGMQLSYHGLNDPGGDLDNSFGNVVEGDFIEYLISLSMEYPIGYRAARAVEQRQIHEKRASLLAYKKKGKQIQREVKDALRELTAAHELIAVRRDKRRADAHYLQALVERVKIEDFTPSYVDQRLRAGNLLRESQRRELAAILQYNIALMRARQVQGTLLQHNNIDFQWPEGIVEGR